MLKITASSLTWNILLNPDLNLFKLYELKSIWLKQANNISKIKFYFMWYISFNPYLNSILV